jgi:hypothetical protein
MAGLISEAKAAVKQSETEKKTLEKQARVPDSWWRGIQRAA